MRDAAKILLVGKTGSGKSSFINYFLGRDVAACGTGRPVTQELTAYQLDDGTGYPIEIFDTKGLEALTAAQQEEEIMTAVTERNSSGDVMDWFHSIFYCVSMSNPRFEDFEAAFLNRMRETLSQHVHIVLTHCDDKSHHKIRAMRSAIEEKLGGDVEIFEVVSVHKQKRTGRVVEPSGIDVIRNRVFDLFAADIAAKLASLCASILGGVLRNVVHTTFDELDSYVRRKVNFFTAVSSLSSSKDVFADDLDDVFADMERDIGASLEAANSGLQQALEPIGKLYTSYRNEVDRSDITSHVASTFEDMFDPNDIMNDEVIMRCTRKAMPALSKFMDKNGDLVLEDDSIGQWFQLFFSGLGDLLFIQKNMRDGVRALRWEVVASLPKDDEIYDRVCRSILTYLAPDRDIAVPPRP